MTKSTTTEQSIEHRIFGAGNYLSECNMTDEDKEHVGTLLNGAWAALADGKIERAGNLIDLVEIGLMAWDPDR